LSLIAERREFAPGWLKVIEQNRFDLLNIGPDVVDRRRKRDCEDVNSADRN
jgi:hypothetical protein